MFIAVVLALIRRLSFYQGYQIKLFDFVHGGEGGKIHKDRFLRSFFGVLS